MIATTPRYTMPIPATAIVMRTVRPRSRVENRRSTAVVYPLRDRTTHVPRDLGERREALLDRRVIHEELGSGALRLRGDDEERVHPLDPAQVLVRDQRHLGRDLLQRAHQVLRRAGDQRGAAVGGVFAVARDR